MAAVIQVMGKEELAEFLAKHRKVVIECSKKAVRLYGSKLAMLSMYSAPVDTGTLKRSIKLDIADEGLSAVVYPTAHYAMYVEYGTRYMSAQPFLKPSLLRVEPQFIKAMDKVMEAK